jgi:hypothetical protein
MTIQTDQATKLAARAPIQTVQVAETVTPATHVVAVQTAPATVLAVDTHGVVIAPISYPSPPF